MEAAEACDGAGEVRERKLAQAGEAGLIGVGAAEVEERAVAVALLAEFPRGVGVPAVTGGP